MKITALRLEKKKKNFTVKQTHYSPVSESKSATGVGIRPRYSQRECAADGNDQIQKPLLSYHQCRGLSRRIHPDSLTR